MWNCLNILFKEKFDTSIHNKYYMENVHSKIKLFVTLWLGLQFHNSTPPSPPAIHQRYFNLNNFENNFVQKNLTVRKVTR